MSTPPTPRPRRRAAWVVPAAVAGVAVAAFVVPSAADATTHRELAPMSAAELLAAVGTGNSQALSGTVVQTTRFGLPTLPGEESRAALDWTSLLTGSHTARVALDGPDRQRVALVGTLAESDVVRSGRDVWTYASGKNREATHLVLPDRSAGATEAAPSADAAQQLTPAAAAERALQAVDPTTKVSVDEKTEVAGRSAYSLVLTPRGGTGTTVRRVVVAVDADTHVPLRVQVYGAGDNAAFETGFTDVSFDRPAASVFTFTPPPEATVQTRDLSGAAQPQRQSATPQEQPQDNGVKVVGTGWASVVVLPAGTSAQLTGANATMLDRLSKPLDGGDRLVQTDLVNVLLPKDGRVLVGAVSPAVLQQVAGG